MSGSTTIIRRIISALETLPKDSLKRYASFKDVQKERFTELLKDTNTDITFLHNQQKSLDNILSNKYKQKFAVSEKLRHPTNNPDYYEVILKEIHGNQKKNSFFSYMNWMRKHK
ncbi:hypothetical protein NADFUDRAFT_83311 [Nadsonia fulvescens var. elongata DSM 6958]|uniref:Cytochrome B pre-mRNA-processing protein 6 n=1 Tax=Nadsonia fulvescens var. elongata DSM 6958 TaxID=857566 RepID=A0A1E3PIP3_9ASCO|nr:hypothetical protein NADFUDRAFT_83311 [Nadsonia fulvescens var. elongata DSM 6958]